MTRGKSHEHLGMTLDFITISNACPISQHDFIKKLCMNLPDNLKGPCRISLAPETFFNADPNTALINRDRGENITKINQKFYS